MKNVYHFSSTDKKRAPLASNVHSILCRSMIRFQNNFSMMHRVNEMNRYGLSYSDIKQRELVNKAPASPRYYPIMMLHS